MEPEVEAASDADQIEQIVKSNGLTYNIVFCVNKLTPSFFKSPIYVCGNNKIQIIINLESKKISISIDCNGKQNDFGDLKYDFYISNQNPEYSLHFNENSKFPFEIDINEKNGWIQNDSFRTVLVIFDNKEEDQTTNKKLSHTEVQKYLHSCVSSKKEKIEWQIQEISEWHMSDTYDVQFASVLFILSLEGGAYNLTMSFQSIQGKEVLVKAKVTLNNKDPAKNIVKNVFESVSSSCLDTNPIIFSELKPEEITAENGWIVDNCFKITVEFTHNRKNLQNIRSRKINAEDHSKKINNICRLPTLDYVQSIPSHGAYSINLKPFLEDVLGKIYKVKIRVGKLFATFSLDIEKKISGFEFENLEDEKKLFSAIEVHFHNKTVYNQYEILLTQNLSKSNSSISFDTPYDSKTVEQEGWVLKNEQNQEQKYLWIWINFDINSQSENVSPFEPFEIKESFAQGSSKKYDVDIEFPQTLFKSQFINLPSLIFGSRKMIIYLRIGSNLYIHACLEGCSDVIIHGSITLANFKNPANSDVCLFDFHKKPICSMCIRNRQSNDFLRPDSEYIDPSTHCSKFKISFSMIEDSQVYLPSEPTYEKYCSYDIDKENMNKDKNYIENQIVGNYAGLINQGATCYMNSMLQAFFHLPAFRRIVYNMPTSGTDNPEKSIPLNLQRLFCEMQFSKGSACSTENLTKSFGWGSQETFVQHDVEEFCRVLLDNLQNKLKGDASLENSIKHLFGVKARHALRCVNVKYESIQEEEMLDIQLNVKGCRNLEESFKKYIEKEILDGDNQYSTEEFGKQNAVMCEEFVEFPPVLHLHLKRFIFDYSTMKMTKLNDYYEFPEQIDLTQFLASDSPNLSKSNLYDLYGVLVHSGGILGGHYNAYLRTSTNKQWYSFNDSHVSPVSTYKAVNANYGFTESEAKASYASFDFLGNKDEIEERNTSKIEKKSKTGNKEDNVYRLFESSKNGYMLIYVRHDDAPILFEPIPKENVPSHLIEYVNEHYRKSSRQSYNDKSNILLFTHENDLNQMTVDNLTNNSMNNNKKQIQFKSKEPLKYSEIYKIAAKEYNANVDEIRIWSCNTNNVPNKVLPNSTNDSLSSNYYSKTHNLFVQKKNKEDKVAITNSQKLVFLKFFFPGREDPLQYLKSIIIDKSDIQTIYTTCRQIIIDFLGLPNDIQLQAYCENLYGFPQLLGSTGYQTIENGLILIFTPLEDAVINPTNFEFSKKTPVENTEAEAAKEDDKSKEEKTKEENNTNILENCNDENIPVYHFSDYFDDLNTKTLIGFIASQNAIEFEVYNLYHQAIPLFKIVTPDKILSELVIKKIIDFAHIDYNNKEDAILLFNLTTDYSNKKVIQHIDIKYQHTSFEKVFKTSPSVLNVKTNRLYFLHRRKLNSSGSTGIISLPNILLSFDAKTIDFIYCLPTKHEMNFHNFINLTKEIIKGIDIGNGPFRLIKFYQSKISDFYTDSSEDSKEMIKFEIMSYYRFELTPPSQTAEKLKENNAVLVRTCYAKEKQYTFDAYNHPFLFDARKDEPFSQTMVRLKKYLGVAESDNLDTYRFVLCTDGSLYTYNSAKKFDEINNEYILYDHCNEKSQLLILSATSKKKTTIKRTNSNEVKIYN